MWFVGATATLSDDAGAGLVPVAADVAVLLAPDRHVTLMFLGHLPEETAYACWRALPQLHLPDAANALRWERFGRSALALVLSDDDGQLEAAATTCHDAVRGLVDLRPPSPFRPHVTMARVGRRGRPPSPSALRGWPLPQGAFRLGPPTLFRSAPACAETRYAAVAAQA